MERYHKINTLFKRDPKGKMLRGQWTCPEFEYLAKNQWDFTEKVDGTNIRVGMWAGYEEPEFAGRTEQADIPPFLMEVLKETFTRERFEAAGLHINPIVLYGEGYGKKIQKAGQLYVDGNDVHKFVLFDVKIGGVWLKREDVHDVADKLGIDVVPSIGSGTLQDAIDIVSTGITFNDAGGVVRWGRGTLQSQWGNFDAEGIVARPVVPLFDRQGNRIITKIKKVDFK